MKKPLRHLGIIGQVAALFAVGILIIGLLTSYFQHFRSDTEVQKLTEAQADEVASEVMASVREYPAWEWLLRYWQNHPNEMDIEYDADFSTGTRTLQKCRLLAGHCPDLELRYATAEELSTLSPEDQKLYAEIVYSWLITRVNQIKAACHVDFLFCVSTDTSYEHQFFLFSAADPGSVRGTNYEEVYNLGTTVTVSQSQKSAMYNACRNYKHLADAGNYVDYYAFLAKVDGRCVLVGMTYDLSAIQASVTRRSIQGTAFAIFHLAILSALCLALISLFVLRPLQVVQQNIRVYRETKDSKLITRNLSGLKVRNEIGQLSGDVIDLAKEIDEYTDRIAAITAEKERIGTELSLASRIQESMLPGTFPAFPDRKEFDLYASMDPAKEVGGDFYDFFFIDDDHLCLFIADVSGKGIPAALFMMASMIVLANNAMMGKSPARILQDTNDAICANNREEMFVTVWLGILEISTGKLTAANAGHEYPILRQPGTDFAFYKDRHSFVIGGMESARYHDYELLLQPRSKLFLYTDGLPEATDASDAMFGSDRILQVLNARPDADPRETLTGITDAVNAFVQDAEQFDDLTMLCLSYYGPQGA